MGECQFNPQSMYLREQQLTFFCGSAPECKVMGSRAALEKAKFNAEKYFSVIGLSEDFQLSLFVMEHYLPRYFLGASQLYQKRTKKQKLNKTKIKEELTAEAKAILRVNMTLEYEFYEFVKERLMKQKRSI